MKNIRNDDKITILKRYLNLYEKNDKEDKLELKQLIMYGIYLITKDKLNEEMIQNLIIKVNEIILKEKDDKIIISNCLGILNNIQELGEKKIFKNKEIINQILIILEQYEDDMIIQKFGFHLIRLASFNENFSYEKTSCLIEKNVELHLNEIIIQEDCCVVLYNSYLNYSNDSKEEIEKKNFIKKIIENIKNRNENNKIIYAIWYALNNNKSLTFIP